MFHEGLENIMRSRPLPSVLSTTVRAAVPAAALALVLAGCAGEPEPASADAAPEAGFPVEVTACGHTSTVEAAPERAVTLNQGATEVMLALGLADRMAGTAYLDDPEPAAAWAEEYASVPVIAKEYPTREELLATRPDFVYASYTSAFDPEVAGPQGDLEADGVASYLSPFGCADQADIPATTFEAVWDEIDAVATAFGVADRGADIRAEQERTLAELGDEGAGAGLDVLWYDSGDKTPLVGAGSSGPQLVLDAVGATNLYADVEDGWADGSWEEVVAADPDAIVLADASWSTAAEKRAYLEKDPVLSQLTAVREGRFATVPYSMGTPGVRLVDGASTLAEQLSALP